MAVLPCLEKGGKMIQLLKEKEKVSKDISELSFEIRYLKEKQAFRKDEKTEMKIMELDKKMRFLKKTYNDLMDQIDKHYVQIRA